MCLSVDFDDLLLLWESRQQQNYVLGSKLCAIFIAASVFDPSFLVRTGSEWSLWQRFCFCCGWSLIKGNKTLPQTLCCVDQSTRQDFFSELLESNSKSTEGEGRRWVTQSTVSLQTLFVKTENCSWLAEASTRASTRLKRTGTLTLQFESDKVVNMALWLHFLGSSIGILQRRSYREQGVSLDTSVFFFLLSPMSQKNFHCHVKTWLANRVLELPQKKPDRIGFFFLYDCTARKSVLSLSVKRCWGKTNTVVLG